MKFSTQKQALIAGISLLIMAVVAGFSYGYVHSGLIIKGDSLATYENLKASKSMFSAEIWGWVVIFATDVIVSISLYHYFKKVNQLLSLGTAAIRLFYSGVLGIAIYHLIAILPLLSNEPTATSEFVENTTAHLHFFETYWSLGLVFFGIHLFGLGLLVFRSGFVPKVFAWLLLFAGVCYFGIHTSKAIFPNYETTISTIEMVLSLPMAVAEIGLGIWLLIRGRKVVS